jgi:heme exporter protein C
MQIARHADSASHAEPAPSTTQGILSHGSVGERVWAGLGVATTLLMLVTVYGIFAVAPVDAAQGQPFRIFYFHVPIAWVAYLAFFVVFVASILYLWRRDERWDGLARAAAEVGTVFTTLVLITGSLWGRPIWNAWWDWSEPRLTVTFILWFIYAGYLMLRSYTGRTAAGARMAAVLGIVAFASVPIDYLSANWWNAVHTHPATSYVTSSGLPGSAVAVLMLSLTTFTLLFALLLAAAYRLERVRTGVERVRGQVQANES